MRTYVLDTSVLLSDPHATKKFDEHQVVLPLVVVSELEAKRHHPELGWFAREALRFLEELRYRYGHLDRPVPANDLGGFMHIELNHSDPSILPAGFRTAENDHRILACALNLQHDGHDVVLVTKDIPLRVKAGAVGLPADDYRAQDVVLTGYSGMVEVDVDPEEIDRLFANGFLELEQIQDQPLHCGVQLSAGSQSALARVSAPGVVKLVRGDTEAFGLKGRSAEQRVALD
ncbi:MAG: PIN domain-containing protein, partial [Corynebacterium sp.]|nr:PIN domain-containing protein [Corynebacterium sp.]